MHAIRVIVVADPQTHTHTHKQTNKQDRLQYTAPQLARSVIRPVESRLSRPFRVVDGFMLMIHGRLTTDLSCTVSEISGNIPTPMVNKKQDDAQSF